MIHRNPLGTIKDLAGEALKVPGKVAGSAVGAARTATERAAHAVGSLAGHDAPDDGAAAPLPTDAEPTPENTPEKTPEKAPAKTPEPAPEKKVRISPDKPVNVTEELGLDPAPVEEPRAPKTPKAAPVTGIDADADASQVDVTPADIADVVAKDASKDQPATE